MQFVPENDTYVYFRYDQRQTVMCILNSGETEKQIDLKRFAERIGGFSNGFDIPTGDNYDLHSNISIKPMSLLVLELRKH